MGPRSPNMLGWPRYVVFDGTGRSIEILLGPESRDTGNGAFCRLRLRT